MTQTAQQQREAKALEAAIRSYMRGCVEEYIDTCGEINITALAEDACQHFNGYGPAPTYEIPELYFELSFEVGEVFEAA